MSRNRQQFGFSLIEVMVSLAIGLFIMAALSYLLVNNISARTELDKTMQQIENGRYAMDQLRAELRLAGYYGPAYSVGSITNTNPCATDPTLMQGALGAAVQGYELVTAATLTNAANVALSACLNSANLTSVGNDVLVIRRAETNSVEVAALAAGNVGTLYLQTNGDSTVTPILATYSGSNAGTYNLTTKSVTAPLRRYQVEIFFVSPCDVPASGTDCTGADDDNGSPIPTLKRIVLPSQTTPESIAQGIERFVVEYGVADANSGTSAASYVTASSVTDWSNVVAIKIHLLARNSTTTKDYEDTKSYQLGPIAVASAGDEYKRHSYSETVRLVNVSGRREGL